MQIIFDTLSNSCSLEETLSRLASSDSVDGLALFGSQVVAPGNPVSDYDLLVLVSKPPVRIFQMLTHINGRMADVVFVETDTADRIFTLDNPASATSAEGMLMQKMLKAQIVYDKSERLTQVQQYVQSLTPFENWLRASTESDIYAAWFWQNHTLLHVKRLAQSDDPVYLTAADMMLLVGIANVCRAYYQVRGLLWEGEKAAVRYLQAHDPGYITLLQACIGGSDRQAKLALYEQLVAHTLASAGQLWEPGITAVFLSTPEQHPSDTRLALAFWERLLGGE